MNLKEEIKKELEEHILPFWMKLIDRENGGFYGEMDFDLNVNKKAEKGCILNSRILWFFSTASMILKRPDLLEYASHAYEFLEEKCIDKKNGGVFWSVNYKGEVLDDTKHTYNQAFAIYALSAYYKASDNKKALERALELYNIIEVKCTDHIGYGESYTVNWNKEDNTKLSENGVIASRTMNTLLHVFEGYCGLYQVCKNEIICKTIKHILNVFKHKVFNEEKNRQEVFFDNDYNSLIDLHSYGHDIETAWLLDWGCSLLDNKELSKQISVITKKLEKEVYNTAYKEGYIYNECENGIDDKIAVWWIQAEAVVGFTNAWQKSVSKIEYLKAAQNIWEYIKKNIIDKRQGSEWFWDVDNSGKPSSKKDIVEPWKCPYHNGRMCFEIIKRL